MQGCLALLEDPREPVRGCGEEDLDGQSSFPPVAGYAGEDKVGDAARAASAAGADVLDVQAYAGDAAVAACTVPPGVQVRTGVSTGKRSLHARARARARRVCVEAATLHVDLGDGCVAAQACCLGEDRVDAMPQRRRQPALPASPIVGTGRAVAAVGRAAPAPISGALLHAATDLIPAVLEFDRDETTSNGAGGAPLVDLLFLVGQVQTGALGTGIDA